MEKNLELKISKRVTFPFFLRFATIFFLLREVLNQNKKIGVKFHTFGLDHPPNPHEKCETH